MALGRQKVSAQARQRHAEDRESGARLSDLVADARAVEEALRGARDEDAPDTELRRLSLDLDSALTDAMRSAYALRRAEVGARGYEDRIYYRRRMAKPHIRLITLEAEKLLTMREEHRLHGIVAVPREYASA